MRMFGNQLGVAVGTGGEDPARVLAIPDDLRSSVEHWFVAFHDPYLYQTPRRQTGNS
jgi:hypothetical protein